MKQTTISVTTDLTIPVGWGVVVTPIWPEEEEEGGAIEEFDTHIVQVGPSALASVTTREIGHVHVSIRIADGVYVPLNSFTAFETTEDAVAQWKHDTHDLRDKLFPTKNEAERYIERLRSRWNCSEPWESFIQL